MSQAPPVVIEAHQAAHQGLAHRVPGGAAVQAPAHLVQGFDFEPPGLVFFQQVERQRRSGFLGRQLQELGPEAVEGHYGEALRGQLELRFISVTPKDLGRQFPEPKLQGRGIRPRLLPFPEEGHDPGAQLPGGLPGKGQGQHLLGGVYPGQKRKKPGQQHRGLAGARRGLQVKTLPRTQGLVPDGLISGLSRFFSVMFHNCDDRQRPTLFTPLGKRGGGGIFINLLKSP